jgi:hypothetical protein
MPCFGTIQNNGCVENHFSNDQFEHQNVIGPFFFIGMQLIIVNFLQDTIPNFKEESPLSNNKSNSSHYESIFQLESLFITTKCGCNSVVLVH